MADVPESTGGPPQTPRSPFQNGVRTSGRAFNSANWRMKSEESPGAQSPSSPRHQMNSSRSPFTRSHANVPQSITEGRRLYVGNMPYAAKTEDVETLFPTEEYKIERIDISIDPFTGRNPSYCFVELATKEQAERAMTELEGKDLLGRPVKIRPGVAKSSNDRLLPRGESSPIADKTAAPFAFDRWQRNDASSHWKGYSEQGRRLYVGGLPRPVSQQAVDAEIRKFFDGFNVEAISKVISPHLSKRFEPGDHYYLFVDFPSSDEAQAALSALDGQVGPWGGKLKVSKAKGESRKVDERTKFNGPSEPQRPSAAREAAAAA
ncbi:ribonucleoprotein, putative [Paecilomyces variotii No. 5]|uniref:Ribonucleoprotein, putative n=1 Tax=Byssochlamys spectabilis (strain No. 5 / NBRC 109023) TaxID=1356009 RepID=V5G0Y4_BYSSN|nr:ribonucleoprotein, putative [Paecilomyces variotii No. 5]